MLEKSKHEAEAIIRDARLAANEEALKIRQETDQSFAARRQERAELEQRLGERETLINAQLERVVQVEKGLQEKKADLQKQVESVIAAAAGILIALPTRDVSSCKALPD